MPNLTTPSTVTFSLQVDQILTLTTNFGGGRVVLSAQRGGDVVFDYTGDQFQNAPVFSSGSQGLVTITHLVGSLTYNVNTSAFGLDSPEVASTRALVSPPGNFDVWPMVPPFVLSSPPTVALSLANAATAISTATDRRADEPGAFTYLGGPVTTAGGNYVVLGAGTFAGLQSQGNAEFWIETTDSTGRFEILTRGSTATANSGLRVAILQPGGTWGYITAGATFAPGVADGNTYRGLVTMGAAGRYCVRVECAPSSHFAGVACLPTDTVTGTGKRKKKYLVVTDSYGTNASDSGGILGADGWACHLSHLTGHDYVVASAGSCGWVRDQAGALVRASGHLAASIAAVGARNLDGVIFALGYNDYVNNVAASEVDAEARKCVGIVQALLPGKDMVFLAPWTVKTLGGASVPHALLQRDTLRAVAAQCGALFLDLLSLPVADRVDGTWASTLTNAVSASGTSLVVPTGPAPFNAGGVAAGRAGWWVTIVDGVNSETRLVTAMNNSDPRTLTVGALTYAHAAGTPVVIGGPQYITGTGRVGATVGDGNADRYIGTDAVHPPAAGHRNIARTVAQLWTRARLG